MENKSILTVDEVHNMVEEIKSAFSSSYADDNIVEIEARLSGVNDHETSIMYDRLYSFLMNNLKIQDVSGDTFGLYERGNNSQPEISAVLIYKKKKLDTHRSYRSVIVNNNVQHEIKDTYYSKYDKNYCVKFDVNVEIHLLNFVEYDIDTKNVYMKRDRERLIFIADDYEVHLTEVIETRGDVNTMRKEIEIEFTGFKDKDLSDKDFSYRDEINYFKNIVEKIWLISRNTDNLHTIDERLVITQVLDKFVERRENPKTGKIRGFHSRDDFPRLRNIKPDDLVSSGIIDPNDEEKYVVAHKADGLRKLLIIFDGKIWLYFPPYDYNLIYVYDADEELTDISDSIYDGELVNKTQYIGFDRLFRLTSGFDDPASNNYILRMQTSELDNIILPQTPYTFETKQFRIITTAQSFFDNTNYLLDAPPSYPIDGLVFIPIHSPYLPNGSTIQDNKARVLTAYDDICKWKNPRDITIDFRIMVEQGNYISLYTYDDYEGIYDLFRGSNYNPVDQKTMIDWDPKLVDVMLIKNEDVGEFEFVRNELDGGNFKLRKLRRDKPTPNTKQTAIENWFDINNPITELSIRGKDLFLAFKLHGRIKKELILSKPAIKVLDIGTGQGGDLDKYAPTIEHLFAVEPNEDNIRVLKERIKANNLENRVTIFATQAEYLQSFPLFIEMKDQVQGLDTVSLMLSLSFFWKSQETLDSLVDLIASNLEFGGRVIFLTIDGKKLLEYAAGQQSIMFNGVEVFHIENPNELGFGNEVYVNLEGTIVGTRQLEYVVNIDDLTSRLLEGHGISLKKKEVAYRDDVLTDEQKRFTKLYSYGEYEKIRKRKIEPSITVSGPSKRKSSIITPLQPPSSSRSSRLSTREKPVERSRERTRDQTSVTSERKREQPTTRSTTTTTSEKVSLRDVVIPSKKETEEERIQRKELARKERREKRKQEITVVEKEIVKKKKQEPQVVLVNAQTRLKTSTPSAETDELAKEEDQVYPLLWSQIHAAIKLFRVVTHGGSLLHAILKLIDPTFVTERSRDERDEKVNSFRALLRDKTKELWLSASDYYYTGKTIDELRRLKQTQGRSILTSDNHSPEAIQYMFGSKYILDNEALPLISELLGLGIIVLRLGDSKIKVKGSKSSTLDSTIEDYFGTKYKDVIVLFKPEVSEKYYEPVIGVDTRENDRKITIFNVSFDIPKLLSGREADFSEKEYEALKTKLLHINFAKDILSSQFPDITDPFRKFTFDVYGYEETKRDIDIEEEEEQRRLQLLSEQAKEEKKKLKAPTKLKLLSERKSEIIPSQTVKEEIIVEPEVIVEPEERFVDQLQQQPYFRFVEAASNKSKVSLEIILSIIKSEIQKRLVQNEDLDLSTINPLNLLTVENMGKDNHSAFFIALKDVYLEDRFAEYRSAKDKAKKKYRTLVTIKWLKDVLFRNDFTAVPEGVF